MANAFILGQSHTTQLVSATAQAAMAATFASHGLSYGGYGGATGRSGDVRIGYSHEGGSALLQDHVPVQDDGYGNNVLDDRYWFNDNWTWGPVLQKAVADMRAFIDTNGSIDTVVLMLGEGDAIGTGWGTDNDDARVHEAYQRLAYVIRAVCGQDVDLYMQPLANRETQVVIPTWQTVSDIQDDLIDAGTYKRGLAIYDLESKHDAGENTGDSHLSIWGQEMLGIRAALNILGISGYEERPMVERARNDVVTTDRIVLYGTSTPETVRGNDGNDILYGEAGDDILIGGRSIDSLVGGQGSDVLVGGEGADRFTWICADLETSGFDTIIGWSDADRLWLKHPTMHGSLNPRFFATGTTGDDGLPMLDPSDATDPLVRFIWIDDTRTLFFDRDGAGGAAPVEMARIDGTAAVTASDFWLF